MLTNQYNSNIHTTTKISKFKNRYFQNNQVGNFSCCVYRKIEEQPFQSPIWLTLLLDTKNH